MMRRKILAVLLLCASAFLALHCKIDDDSSAQTLPIDGAAITAQDVPSDWITQPVDGWILGSEFTDCSGIDPIKLSGVTVRAPSSQALVGPMPFGQVVR